MKTMNEAIIKTFEERFACKSFDSSKKISDEDFNTILNVIHLSPSSFGFEPYKVLVITSPEIKKRLYPVAWGARNTIDGAQYLLIILARTSIDTRYDSDYIKHIMLDVKKFPQNIMESRLNNYKNFQENDFKLLESDRALFDWACKQAYIVLANILYTAALLKIDSCPIEGFNMDAVNKILEEEHLIDNKHFKTAVMVGLGYRKDNPQFPKTRQDIKDVIQFVK